MFVVDDVCMTTVHLVGGYILYPYCFKGIKYIKESLLLRILNFVHLMVFENVYINDSVCMSE